MAWFNSFDLLFDDISDWVFLFTIVSIDLNCSEKNFLDYDDLDDFDDFNDFDVSDKLNDERSNSDSIFELNEILSFFFLLRC